MAERKNSGKVGRKPRHPENNKESKRKTPRGEAREAAGGDGAGVAPEDLGKEFKRPLGRPRTTVDDLPSNWKELMMLEAQEGHGPTAYMVKLGINNHALNTLLQDSEDFRTTYEICFLLCRYWWENQGRRMAMGYAGNAAVWKMNMINRFKWQPDNNVIINNPGNGTDGSLPAEQDKHQLTREELMKELELRGLPTKLLVD